MQRLVWTPELVNKFWNGVSQTKLGDISFCKTGGHRLFDFVGHLFKPGTSCLDVGAGDGDLAQMAADRGCMVAVLEPSQTRQEAIRKQVFTKTSQFLGFVERDSKQKFDLVVATEVIEHVLDEDMDEFLNLLQRSLKPGGVLLITTPNEEDLELNMAYCPVSDVMFHRWQHVRSFTTTSLVDLLSRIGFAKQTTHRVSYESSVGSEIHYWKVLGPAFVVLRPVIKYLTAKFAERRGLHIGNSGLIFVGVKDTN